MRTFICMISIIASILIYIFLGFVFTFGEPSGITDYPPQLSFLVILFLVTLVLVMYLLIKLMSKDYLHLKKYIIIIVVFTLIPFIAIKFKINYYSKFTHFKWIKYTNARRFMIDDLVPKIKGKNMDEINLLLGKDNTNEYKKNEENSFNVQPHDGKKIEHAKYVKVYYTGTEPGLQSYYNYYIFIYFDENEKVLGHWMFKEEYDI